MPVPWIDHIRIRKAINGQFDMFVVSRETDSGQQHFGLSMAEVHDKIDEYEEDMAIRVPNSRMLV